MCYIETMKNTTGPAANGISFLRTKVAVIRDPSVPPGGPAPMWLNCPCGAKPATTYQGPDVACTCGAVYDSSGHVLGSVR
jgi:hypothetical protein